MVGRKHTVAGSVTVTLISTEMCSIHPTTQRYPSHPSNSSTVYDIPTSTRDNQFCSQFRDPNFTSKEDDDEDYDNGFDFGLDNIDYDNMNFYEMEMYPSSMYDPEEGPDERWVGVIVIVIVIVTAIVIVICWNNNRPRHTLQYFETAISASSTMKRWSRW